MSIEGKNKRRQLEVYDSIHKMTLSVDSQEEVDFINYCCEAVQLSVINDFHYQPCSFQLFADVKYEDINGKERTLFREHRYSPDIVIELDPKKNLVLSKEFKIPYSQLSSDNCSVYIDVKGTFNTTERSFSYNQKWTFQKFGVYICKIIPKKFFALFGVPQKSICTKKTKQPRKIFQGCRSIKEIFNLD